MSETQSTYEAAAETAEKQLLAEFGFLGGESLKLFVTLNGEVRFEVMLGESPLDLTSYPELDALLDGLQEDILARRKTVGPQLREFFATGTDGKSHGSGHETQDSMVGHKTNFWRKVETALR